MGQGALRDFGLKSRNAPYENQKICVPLARVTPKEPEKSEANLVI